MDADWPPRLWSIPSRSRPRSPASPWPASSPQSEDKAQSSFFSSSSLLRIARFPAAAAEGPAGARLAAAPLRLIRAEPGRLAREKAQRKRVRAQAPPECWPRSSEGRLRVGALAGSEGELPGTGPPSSRGPQCVEKVVFQAKAMQPRGRRRRWWQRIASRRRPRQHCLSVWADK